MEMAVLMFYWLLYIFSWVVFIRNILNWEEWLELSNNLVLALFCLQNKQLIFMKKKKMFSFYMLDCFSLAYKIFL